MSGKILLVLGLLILSGSVSAQRCPQGTPNAPNCIPPDHPASPYANRTQPPMRRMIWADRWGAIAVDNTNNGVGIGVAVGERDESEAKKTALAECRAKGGGVCEIELTYFNQCGVIIWGNTGYNTASAATITEATKIGMQTCSAEDVNCHVYYSACSMAERIQ